MKQIKSFRLSQKALKNLKRFTESEEMSEGEVIETLLTHEVPAHCEDMLIGDGNQPGDFTFANLTFEYRFLTKTDKRGKNSNIISPKKS